MQEDRISFTCKEWQQIKLITLCTLKRRVLLSAFASQIPHSILLP